MNSHSQRMCWSEAGRTALHFWLLALLIIGLAAALPVFAAPTTFTVQVRDHAGNPVSGFRWTLEEDRTYAVTPGVHTTDALALGFHVSHSPVLKQGDSSGDSAVIDGVDTTKRYFISVLPFAGYSNGGAQVGFAASATPTVNVLVAQHPIPTAQISVFAYEDRNPINNAPDLPQEPGLPGFSVLLFDPAGQYGVAGGQVSQDAFGNPLGTEYNADGTVATLGSGVILTNTDGVALIRNLAPGKYGVQIVPPAGQDWHQTHTIEGTPTIDAWVKANEPRYFTEFGPPGHHVFIGFVKSFDCYGASGSAPAGYCAGAAAPGTGTIHGQIVNMHMARPPEVAFYNGQPFPNCWIGLNDAPAGTGQGVYAQPCNADSSFNIGNVPPGDYELVVWDEPLDIIFATVPVTVPAGGGDISLGQVPVFNWNHRSEHLVFFDRNQNGFRDCTTLNCDDPALDDVNLGADQAAINLRFRDGRIYQTMPIDVNGEAPLEEVFPFFNWLVAEVSFGTLKATGVTVTVDAGGPVAPGEVLTPQPQNCTQADIDAGACTTLGDPLINPNTGDNLSRTETGPVLLEAFQGFLGQTNKFEWGKSTYAAGENGGITGVVFYAVTRAENDPRYAVGEEWEPGIPRVQVNLYADANGDGVIDVAGGGAPTPPDVDNYPLGWSDGTAPMGPEDVDRNGNGVFDMGDALRVTHTDSWDDSLPTGCQGDVFVIDGIAKDCFDGLRTFNQVRPGVFDGGYAFGSPNPSDLPLPAGTYIVEVAVPGGYTLLKEEDKNVDLGDAYTPSPLLLPPLCVGDAHPVPAYISMQSDASGTPYPGIAAADLVAAPFAGISRPLCDRKQVRLSQGQNAAADFFLFTEAPKAAMVQGFILNDLGNEFDPNAPNFGEKYAPPWLPVSFRDWTGAEIVRVHADEWGLFNAMLPSTYSVHIPMPSGVSPNMITACMNDAGPVPNPAYDPVTNPSVPQTIVDPYFDRRYSQFCYTLQYMPGGTTYLDTPVLPIAAFAGPGAPVDCEPQDQAPVVYSVSGPNGSGPYVLPGQQLTILAAGNMDVPNPAYDGTNSPQITRHYGFGTQGPQSAVTIGGVPLTIDSWGDDMILATVPASGVATGQLLVSNAVGTSPSAVTVTVGPLPAGISVHQVMPSADPAATPIQDAIDLAGPNDLILVSPGTYDELVVMYKPVRLQGWGALATVINARKAPAEKLQAWRNKIDALLTAGAFELLPGQTAGFTPADNEPVLFADGEGAGIIVLGKNSGPARFRFRTVNNARIDGFTITGADQGSGIFANGYARFLEISNNRIVGNQGTFGGGIRIGHADLTTDANGLEYTNSVNNAPYIHHNDVSMNGGLSGAGGGIALYTGAYNYNVSSNFICGNFTAGNGGGIGHLGLSSDGRIAGNSILFNQSFDQGLSVSGGGIYVGGQVGLGGTGTVSPGAGNVTIDGNLLQGNLAGAGDGGALRTERVNGEDVARRPNNPNQWFTTLVTNNIMVNNVTGLAGGGISMVDTLRPRIINNTIAHNDSTATAGQAFAAGNASQSVAQPAGVVAHANSPELSALIPAAASFDQYRAFSNPWLLNNIIWQNRSFYWAIQGNPNNADPTTFGLLPDIGAGGAPVFDDLAVLGVAAALNPRFCVLTDTTGYHSSNQAGDPSFVAGYFNGDRGQTIVQQELTTSIQAQPALDEGGNFIDVRFGPLTPVGDYHLLTPSIAIDAANTANTGSIVELSVDYDGEPRPSGAAADIGADEVQLP